MPNARWIPAYVGLGANLDDPRAQVERALAALAALPDVRLVTSSRFYRTPPFGPVEQPEFVNAVAGLLTQRPARDFLAQLKTLEAELGRAAPSVRWGPRRIDLDLLVHGTTQIDEPGIRVPHPGIAERAFVLRPFADIAPELNVPGAGRVAALLRRVDASQIVPLAA